MAESPIGVTFMPTAEASANGPRQAGIEGQGGSDLAQAFKILSLHLPRVLGASAIAPKRLLTSQGAAGVAAPAGVSPYSQVFQALLQSMGAGGGMAPSDPMAAYGAPGGGAGAGFDLQSLASLFSGPTSYVPDGVGAPDTGAPLTQTYGPPPPKVTFNEPPGGDPFSGSASPPSYNAPWSPEPNNRDTQYI